MDPASKIKANLLTSEENEKWEEYVASRNFGNKPDKSDELSVKCFRADRIYQKLIAQDDEFIKNVPNGDWVMINLTTGTSEPEHGSIKYVQQHFKPGMFMIQHKPERKHLHCAKVAISDRIDDGSDTLRKNMSGSKRDK